MRVYIRCPEKVAADSRREVSEYIEADPADTGEDIKIKITMLYTSLDPERFIIYLNGRRLISDKESIRALGPIEYIEVREGSVPCCRLI